MTDNLDPFALARPDNTEPIGLKEQLIQTIVSLRQFLAFVDWHGATETARPMSTAPEVTAAPLLLWLTDINKWQVGCWDGKSWRTEGGFIVEPTAWAPLPVPPVPA